LSETFNRNWDLRAQLYSIFHRWPLIISTILLGCLLGWGLSYVWPSHSRATSQIYLALNPYRRYSDAMFEALANPRYSNLDNYQYWQMSQLESAVFMDRFLQPTLDALRQQDPYWESVSIEDLRSMLDSEWRTTGTWSLIANHAESERARQAASAWSAIAIEEIGAAVDASRRTFMVDQELQAGETELLRVSLRRDDLESTREWLLDWQKTAEKLAPSSQLEPADRWNLVSTISFPAEFTPAWMALLQDQPTEDSPLADYQDWVNLALTVIQNELLSLHDRSLTLDQSQTEAASQFAIESKESLSFSPNIEIERKEDLEVRTVRPTSTFILIGGTLGLLVWLLFELVRLSISRSSR
jgi:hypothetical protein